MNHQPVNMGKVWLVGAGCGDPDLLTLKAVQALNQADVVVHDALVNPQILAHAPADVLTIYVGKRKGCQVMPQCDINDLLVRLAQQGKTVVRLKGGDPFVFGRGGEELAALDTAGIAVEVVPGVSAALGAAASLGMPLTHRAYAQALTFVSAHRQHGRLEVDWDLLTRNGQTVVIYMGLSVLPELVAGLRAHGLAATHPVAVIARATLSDEAWVQAPLDGIVASVTEAGLSSPALVVVGECAAFAAARANPGPAWAQATHTRVA